MGICLRITDLEDDTAALGGAYNNLAFMECRLLPTVLGPWPGQRLDRLLFRLNRLLPAVVGSLGWSWLALCLQVGACALPVFYHRPQCKVCTEYVPPPTGSFSTLTTIRFSFCFHIFAANLYSCLRAFDFSNCQKLK